MEYLKVLWYNIILNAVLEMMTSPNSLMCMNKITRLNFFEKLILEEHYVYLRVNLQIFKRNMYRSIIKGFLQKVLQILCKLNKVKYISIIIYSKRDGWFSEFTYEVFLKYKTNVLETLK